MKKIIYVLTALITASLLSSCAGLITLKTPEITGGKIEKAKYVAKKPPAVFEDFEAGTLVGAYTYANAAANAWAKYTIIDPDKDTAKNGSYCAKAEFFSGSDSAWGCGFGSQSVYGGGYVDAKDREYINLWIKAPKGMSFYIFVNEAQANGADGEYWNSMNLSGTGDWKLYEIPMDTFFRNIYSGSQSGNNMIDMSGIGTVGAQVGGAQGEGVVYIDDITFR